MADFINQHFLPVKIHIKEHPTDFHRFEANWTPTLELLDPEGRERYRFSGWLPKDEFLAQLYLGLGKMWFAHKRWTDAERWLRELPEKFPGTDAAPEALYWAAVCRYKASNDHHALGDVAQDFQRRYTNTSWAKRSSVWLPKPA